MHELGDFSQDELPTDETADCFCLVVLPGDRSALGQSENEEVLRLVLLKIGQDEGHAGFSLGEDLA
jgi:hypothetical protein